MLDVGNWGYWMGAAGIVAFTATYLVTVRWWTDILGRVIAGVFSATSATLVISTIRLALPEIGGTFLAIRAVIYWSFGLAVWVGIAAFLWAQFVAPRGHTSRKEFLNEEARSPAGGDDRHGDLHDGAGRPH